MKILLLSLLLLVGCDQYKRTESKVICVDEDGKVWKSEWSYRISMNQSYIYVNEAKHDLDKNTGYRRQMKPGEVCRRLVRVIIK